MALQYSLVPNELTPDPNDCRAKIENLRKHNVEKIIEQLTVSGSIFKVPETRAIISAFLGQLKSNLQEGIGFSSEYFDLEPNIQGVFISGDDRFDDTRHYRVVNMIVRNQFNEALDNLKVQCVSNIELFPSVKQVYDVMSSTTNQKLTPGGTAEVEGDLLRFDTEKVTQGVFLINIATKEEIRVDKVYHIYRKSLSFVVPATLTAGTYELQVRNTVFSKENMREGKLKANLTVS